MKAQLNGFGKSKLITTMIGPEALQHPNRSNGVRYAPHPAGSEPVILHSRCVDMQLPVNQI